MFSQSFKAIGTTWHIDFKNTEAHIDASGVFNSIVERIEIFEQNYSRFRSDSLVSQIAERAGVYILPKDAKQLLALYRKLYEITGGKVTPLIGQLLIDTGYDAQYSLTPKQIKHPTPKWDDVMKFDEKTNILTTYTPIQLDFGALGKGYIVDIVSQMILDAGITEFTVDAGGDIHHEGEQIRIGLEHPSNREQVIGVAEIAHGSICGSSGNRRTWNEYHHILNPDTQQSPREILALWVTSSSTMTADGLTTALFFVEPSELQKYFSFEYVIVDAQGSAFVSPNFPGSLF